MDEIDLDMGSYGFLFFLFFCTSFFVVVHLIGDEMGSRPRKPSGLLHCLCFVGDCR
jgi:hypothetical protein